MSRSHRIARTLRAISTRRKTCPTNCSLSTHVGPSTRTSLAKRPLSSQCSSALDVLREISELSPKLTRLSGRASEPVTSRLETLNRTAEQLRKSASSSRLSIAVYSLESGREAASDLVTALLSDPLSSDDEQQLRIRQCWNGAGAGVANRPLTFEYRPQHSYTPDTNTMHVTSPWLSQRPMLLTALPPASPLDQENLARLFGADVPIIVTNPLSETLDDTLDHLRWIRHPNVIVVVNATVGTRTAERAGRSIAHKLGRAEGTAPRVIFANIDQALHALDALQENPTSPSAIQDYQFSTSNSQISNLTDVLDSIINSQSVEVLRDRIAHSISSCAASDMRTSLEPIRNDIFSAKSLASSLRQQVQSEGDSAIKQLFGPSTDYESLQIGTSELRESDYGLIYDLHMKAGKLVQQTIRGLSWWKLPVVADEVSYRVDGAVERAYRGDVEQHLVFHTGRLSALQRHFLSLASSNLTSLIPPSLTSPLLANTLAQLSSSPSFDITPTQFLIPALTRLSSLTTSTIRLHKSANRLVLSTVTSSLSSAALSAYLCVASPLDVSTALGLTSLISVGVLRWAVGRWEHAKRKWSDDWRRVGKAVERDVREEARKCLDKQLFVVPISACEGVQELARKREEECGEVEGRLKELEKRLNDSQSSSAIQGADSDGDSKG